MYQLYFNTMWVLNKKKITIFIGNNISNNIMWTCSIAIAIFKPCDMHFLRYSSYSLWNKYC